MSDKEAAENLLESFYHNTGGTPLIVNEAVAKIMREAGIAGEGKTWLVTKYLKVYDTKEIQRKAPVLFPVRKMWPPRH